MNVYVAICLILVLFQKIEGQETPVGTCSLQGRVGEQEVLPDQMCYEACTNNAPVGQQRYLICNEMKCFCRTMQTDTAVAPLNAGAATNSTQQQQNPQQPGNLTNSNTTQLSSSDNSLLPSQNSSVVGGSTNASATPLNADAGSQNAAGQLGPILGAVQPQNTANAMGSAAVAVSDNTLAGAIPSNNNGVIPPVQQVNQPTAIPSPQPGVTPGLAGNVQSPPPGRK